MTVKLHCTGSTAVGADLALTLDHIACFSPSTLLQDSMPAYMHPVLQPNVHATMHTIYGHTYSHTCNVRMQIVCGQLAVRTVPLRLVCRLTSA